MWIHVGYPTKKKQELYNLNWWVCWKMVYSRQNYHFIGKIMIISILGVHYLQTKPVETNRPMTAVESQLKPGIGSHPVKKHCDNGCGARLAMVTKSPEIVQTRLEKMCLLALLSPYPIISCIVMYVHKMFL